MYMFDDITLSLLPSGQAAYAGYVDGTWDNFVQLRALYPRAHLLDIAVFASDDATCLDIETGDATNAQAADWVKRQQARGIRRPVPYTNEGNAQALVNELAAAGIARSQYRLWLAHYTNSAHICGPSTCGCPVAADGTQFTSHAKGISLDESELTDTFFGAPPAPPSPPTGDEMTPGIAYWYNPNTKKYQIYQAVRGADGELDVRGPDTGNQWMKIPGANVNPASGVAYTITPNGERYICYVDTAGKVCGYYMAPGGGQWQWQDYGGQV